jgi:hypothetical protein
MTFCNSCGAAVKPGAKFCAGCGTPVVPAAPEQGTTRRADNAGLRAFVIPAGIAGSLAIGAAAWFVLAGSDTGAPPIQAAPSAPVTDLAPDPARVSPDAASTTAQTEQVSEPGFGTPERKAIMDGVRRWGFSEDTLFVVHHIRVIGDWAYTGVVPTRDGIAVGEGKTFILRRGGDGWRVFADWGLEDECSEFFATRFDERNRGIVPEALITHSMEITAEDERRCPGLNDPAFGRGDS